MARPKIAADRLRTATIGVRVSPAEYAALKEKATTMGMTPAQWLRAAALARQLPPPPAPPVNLDTYRELGRIGNNLNQVVARINAGDAPAEIPRDIAAGLVRLVKTIQLQVLGGAE
ncbi:MAG TPA: plasmid mobilization relaxosome protein MobC [Acidobacteriota bacterium]|nr:plasmid mobilization relaxosome protein MobC [Acidobacteriota bacterium]